MFVKIRPVSKPRMTNRDRWGTNKRPSVARYHTFSDELRSKLDERQLPDRLLLRFFLPMPAYWSKKKQAEMARMPHQQKPDIDNLCKAVMDALAADDSYIHELSATKQWVYQGEEGIYLEDIKGVK